MRTSGGRNVTDTVTLRTARGSASAGRVRLEPAGTVAVAELDHDLALDLAHPLAREAELLADLVERARLPVVEPVAQPDHVLLALVQRRDDAAHVVVEQPRDDRRLGVGGLGVLDEVPER